MSPSICELRNLNKIRGCLRIDNLENVADEEEAKMAKLHNKVYLEPLSLRWNKLKNCSNDEVRVQEEVLEGLQPLSNIKGIGISRYMGLKHPSWLNKSYLSNIEGIFLFACGCLKALPPLGEFPFLKYLSLDSLTSVEKIGRGGVFQSFQLLTLEDLEELREWPSIKEDVGDMIPHLSKLKIRRCNKLEALPPLGGLQSLEDLILEQLDSLMKIETKTSGREGIVLPKLDYLKLSSIKRLNEWLAPNDGQSLMPHLTHLLIINCPNLKVIPTLGELPSLKDLYPEGLDLLEDIGIDIYGRKRITFPLLRPLNLIDLKELKKWSCFKEDVCDMMSHLSWLEITRCNKLEALPPLGGFHAQPVLTIKDCSNLKLIPPKELPSFQSLDLERLDSLEEIDIPVEEQGRDLMPHLQRLTIIDCHKLRRPTHFTSSLEELTFGFSKTVDGMQMFHELFPVGTLSCLKSLFLRCLTGLDSFTDAQQEWFQSLTSLRELSFKYCSDLRSLPDVLESLCHLEGLTLTDCPKIVSLGQNNLPKNLKKMEIIRCGELGKLCDWRQDGREWSKISHIPRIEIDTGYCKLEYIPHRSRS